MKTLILFTCCFLSFAAFAQQKTGGQSGATSLINCLGDRTPCTPPPVYNTSNSQAMRGIASPSQSSSDFLNGFANSYAITTAATTNDAEQIVNLAVPKPAYKNLTDYINANPRSNVAASIQKMLTAADSYEAFQTSLSGYYNSLTAQADKDIVYSLSNALDIVNRNSLSGRAASVSCSGWWSCWGKCAGSILGGVLTGGLSGGAAGTAVPGVGTVAGGIIGGIAGGIHGAVNGCN